MFSKQQQQLEEETLQSDPLGRPLKRTLTVGPDASYFAPPIMRATTTVETGTARPSPVQNKYATCSNGLNPQVERERERERDPDSRVCPGLSASNPPHFQQSKQRKPIAPPETPRSTDARWEKQKQPGRGLPQAAAVGGVEGKQGTRGRSPPGTPNQHRPVQPCQEVSRWRPVTSKKMDVEWSGAEDRTWGWPSGEDEVE